jgi:putative proteasome-type protease
LKMNMRRRFDQGDPYFTALSKEWSDGVRRVFTELPVVAW